MNIDPVRRQSLISLGSTLGLTAVGFVATMYFAHAVGAAAYGVFSLFLARAVEGKNSPSECERYLSREVLVLTIQEMFKEGEG